MAAKAGKSTRKPKRGGAPRSVRRPRGSAPSSERSRAADGSRREELLEAALKLVSERGIAGASLRVLARELGMSQPGLYHYFTSKHELIREIVEYCAQKMMSEVSMEGFPSDPQRLPRVVIDGVLSLWSGARHPRFTRFLFVVAIESDEHRRTIQHVFETVLYGSMPLLGRMYSKDPKRQDQIVQTTRALVSALGLALLEERALFGRERPSAPTLEFAEFLVRAGEHLLQAPAAPRVERD